MKFRVLEGFSSALAACSALLLAAFSALLFAACTALLFAACSAVPGLGRIDDRPAGESPAAGQAALEAPVTAGERETSPPQGTTPAAGGTDAAAAPYAPAPPAAGGVCGGELLVDEAMKGDCVLAEVDGIQIRASDLYRTFFLENPLRTRNALQNEILYILTRKESLRLGVTVGNAEAEDVLARTIEDHRARCAAYIDETVTLEKFVEAQYGMPFEEYRELLRRTAVFKLLLDRCVRFQEMACRRYRLGVIVVDDVEKAADIRQKLVRGASLEVLAEKHSLDRSASSGGVLAPIPGDARHPLHPLVESAAHLSAGEVSEVEEISFASRTMYRIIKLIQIIEPIEGSFREAAVAVQKSLEDNPVDLASIQYWQKCQRERYAVEVRAL